MSKPDKLHGEAAKFRRGHIPVAKWTDREIFIDLLNFIEKYLKIDKNVHGFFDNKCNRDNDKLFRKVLEVEDADGVMWVHTVRVRYTKTKRH